MKNSDPPFIPAQESRWFIFLFDLYVRSLFRRRFSHVWVDQGYQPESGSKTIYYLNHTSWWDGLIPLLLNRKLFRQNARAMMEIEQMRTYSFFKKIGAFSVNPDHPRSTVQSLRYAVESLKRPHSSLFIYPEGQIVPFSTGIPIFKKGLDWIVKQCPETEVVPIGVYMHSVKSDKPEIFIKIGKVLDFSIKSQSRKQLCLETEMSKLLTELHQNAHGSREHFNNLFSM